MIFNISQGGLLLFTWAAAAPDQHAQIHLVGTDTWFLGTVVAARDGLIHIRFDKLFDSDETSAFWQMHFPQTVAKSQEAHTVLVRRLADAVSGRIRISPANLGTEQNCCFGRWIRTLTDSSLDDCQSYHTLLDVHHRLHEKAREVLLVCQSEDVAPAALGLDDAHALCQEFCRALDDFSASGKFAVP
jgi:hypothetical protein